MGLSAMSYPAHAAAAAAAASSTTPYMESSFSASSHSSAAVAAAAAAQVSYRNRANKGRGFYSKDIFWTYAPWCIWPKFVHAHVAKKDKIRLNKPVLSRFKGWG